MPIPIPTPIVRFIHIDNLAVVLHRQELHAPNHTPDNGLVYKTIHNDSIQHGRSRRAIDCGPQGVIHDYVAFYFGYLSPMMLQLATGRVEGYSEGQEPLIYLVSTVQALQTHGSRFVFSDGHGLAAFTAWYDDPSDLDKVDWTLVNQRYWADDISDMDRQRRKQAELLVYRSCDWSLIERIVVIDSLRRRQVERIFAQHPSGLRRPVEVRRDWYYPTQGRSR